LRRQLPHLDLEDEHRRSLTADLATVDAQLASPQPNDGALREALRTLRAVAEGVAGNAAFAGLVDTDAVRRPGVTTAQAAGIAELERENGELRRANTCTILKWRRKLQFMEVITLGCSDPLLSIRLPPLVGLASPRMAMSRQTQPPADGGSTEVALRDAARSRPR
jgi:hypothetical protein